MTSKLVVNTIEADTGISSVSFASSISMDSTSKFHFSAAGVDIGADTNINRPAAGVLGFNISGAEKLRIDTNGHLNTSGIVTAANFKSGVTNVHNLGVTLTGGQLDVGSNIKIGTAGVVTATSFVGSGANLTSLPTQITINNNSNGRVITATGNANELDSQANLTFSNSSNDPKLYVSGSGHAQLFLTNTSGADHTGVNFGDSADTNAGMIQYSNSNNAMQFHTNGSEKLRITSNGHVLLGTGTDYADVNSDDVQIYSTSHTGISITSGTSSYGSIYFGDGTSGDSRNEGILRYYHGDNSMAIWANRSEKLRIESDGDIRLLSENGNNSDTPGIYFRGGSSSQKANFAKIHSRMVSNWGGQLQFKVKDDNGSLSDAYQTAMIMNHNGHVTKPNQPVFSAHSGSTRSAGVIVFDVTSCNVGGHYSTSNGRFTAPVAGTYYFSFYGMSPHNNTTNQRVRIRVNGTNFSGGEHTGGVAYSGYTNNGYTHLTLSTALPLAVNDYVQIDWQYANLHDNHCKFTGFLVG